ncbi:hypothetical protein D1816_08090 [Aquimarina sp. AD10]|uniref:2TM domain-containing protein n=1 Tax=Aquimarina aggregata TaxID=1642818 RepID=A0A162XSQ2_9FLAO|nr:MULTISPECIES: 2TM domain-containing protein [Aquimarina]AXT60311.1 hypothetical protein D1816_08090 [Aquimarina sp. AD10]KZS38748.1 hypothetical protein AWE51_14270 [Aquimarina aggregata]RKN01254.1 hypothetical protein D7033_05390 [Aquimarina sp. AD10]
MENFEQQRYEKAKKRVEREKGFYTHFTIYLAINLILLIINSNFLNEGFSNFSQWWLYITPISWGIGLLFHGLSVFAKTPIFNKKWEEKKIKELMDKDEF